MSASEARKRLAATLKKAKDLKAAEAREEEEAAPLAAATLTFEGSISAVFEKHLRCALYVEYSINHE